MSELPLDIRISIASVDYDTWIWLALRDEEVYDYTRNNLRVFVKLFTKYTIDGNNYEGPMTICYLIDKKHSINDQPAITTKNGRWWYYNNKVHRDTRDKFNNVLPAIIHSGQSCWYLHGIVCRENDLPALIDTSGDQYWYLNGKLGRANDKPARIGSNGDQYWYHNDSLHRDTRDSDGNLLPVIICTNGVMQYGINNMKVSKDYVG